MAINRYYQPNASNYISQFVPEELPTNLLIGALQNKQTQQDTLAAAMETNVGDWSHVALPGDDTAYIEQEKKKNRDWIDSYFNQDLTTGKAKTELMSKIRSLRDDKNLKAVKQNYDIHNQYKERYTDLVKKGAYSDAEALRYDYDQRFNQYTKTGSGGFRGEIKLGNPLITEGINKVQAAEDLVNQMKEDSQGFTKFLNTPSGSIAYHQSSGGLSNVKLADGVIGMATQIYESPLGQQLGAEFDMKTNPGIAPSIAYNNMTPEEKVDYSNKRNQYIIDQVQTVARTFRNSNSDNNLDVALRSLDDRNAADARAMVKNRTITAPGTQTGQADYSTDSEKYKNNLSQLDRINRELEIRRTGKANNRAEQVVLEQDDAYFNNLQKQKDVLLLNNSKFDTRKVNALAVALPQVDNRIDPRYVNEFFRSIDSNINKSNNYQAQLLGKHDKAILEKIADGQYTDEKGKVHTTPKEISYAYVQDYNNKFGNGNQTTKDLEQRALIMGTLFEEGWLANYSAHNGSDRPYSMKTTNIGEYEFQIAYKPINPNRLSEATDIAYNNSGTVVNNATARSEDKVELVDNNGNVIKNVASTHSQVEELIKGDPNKYTWVNSNGEVLDASLVPRNIKDLKIVSEDINSLPDGKRSYTIAIEAPRGWGGLDKKETYTVITPYNKSINDNYNHELYSQYKLDPDGENGKRAFKVLVARNYPEIGREMNTVHLLKSGESTILPVNNYDENNNIISTSKIEVTRAGTVGDSYNVKLVNTGKSYNPNTKNESSINIGTFNSIEELGDFYLNAQTGSSNRSLSQEFIKPVTVNK